MALIHWSMPPTTGGVESHVADLARGLAELGCSVSVLTGEPLPVPVAGVELLHIPLLDLGLLRSARASLAELTLELTQVLSGVLAACRFHVIHGHNLHHFSAGPALALDALRHQLGFRLHHTFHETWPDVLHGRPVYRAWDGNYAVSRHVQEQCARRIGFRPELRPLGVDTEHFRSRRAPLAGREGFVILHPARVLPWKGVHLSVDMLARLRARGLPARLLVTDTQRIVDWGQELVAYREQVLARMREQGVADAVEFRSVGYAEMPRLYDEADLVVYPTVGEEPYGLVPLEAMSMARPVVASRSGGMRETVVDGRTGFLVERGDAAALADAVERLLRDPGLGRRMGEAGRRHVVANFNGREYATRLLARYRRGGLGHGESGAAGVLRSR